MSECACVSLSVCGHWSRRVVFGLIIDFFCNLFTYNERNENERTLDFDIHYFLLRMSIFKRRLKFTVFTQIVYSSFPSKKIFKKPSKHTL